MCLACSVNSESKIDYVSNSPEYNAQPAGMYAAGNSNYQVLLMEANELFLDEDIEQLETMRNARKKLKETDFAKLINKRDLSGFEMDEIFAE